MKVLIVPIINLIYYFSTTVTFILYWLFGILFLKICYFLFVFFVIFVTDTCALKPAR